MKRCWIELITAPSRPDSIHESKATQCEATGPRRHARNHSEILHDDVRTLNHLAAAGRQHSGGHRASVPPLHGQSHSLVCASVVDPVLDIRGVLHLHVLVSGAANRTDDAAMSDAALRVSLRDLDPPPGRMEGDCDYCHLPVTVGTHPGDGPHYCCYGCRLAAEVTGRGGAEGE